MPALPKAISDAAEPHNLAIHMPVNTALGRRTEQLNCQDCCDTTLTLYTDNQGELGEGKLMEAKLTEFADTHPRTQVFERRGSRFHKAGRPTTGEPTRKEDDWPGKPKPPPAEVSPDEIPDYQDAFDIHDWSKERNPDESEFESIVYHRSCNICLSEMRVHHAPETMDVIGAEVEHPAGIVYHYIPREGDPGFMLGATREQFERTLRDMPPELRWAKDGTPARILSGEDEERTQAPSGYLPILSNGRMVYDDEQTTIPAGGPWRVFFAGGSSRSHWIRKGDDQGMRTVQITGPGGNYLVDGPDYSLTFKNPYDAFWHGENH